MNDETLIRALHRITIVDNLRCFGCGYQNHCSTHGCAIIKEAAERIQVLTSPQPNEPLTLEELREMDGEPVWIERKDGATSRWAIVGDAIDYYKFYFVTGVGGMGLYYDQYNEFWIAYRRRPEEGDAWQP